MGYVNSIFSKLLVFEKYKLNIRLFNSAKCANNQLFIILYGIGGEVCSYLKNSLSGYLYSLAELTGLDLTKLQNYKLFFNMEDWGFQATNCDRLNYYNLFDYKTSQRAIVTSFYIKGSSILSVDNIFYNASWLERELVEFFGSSIPSRLDTRNLLLDYNLQVNPLLKTYPTEGHQEIFFNYLSYNLEYVNTEFIEL